MAPTRGPRRAVLRRVALRLAVIAVVILLVNMGLGWVLDHLGKGSASGTGFALTALLGFSLVLYAVLMAIPFVPGVEIGVSLLLMQGARVAPFVFLATFSGLACAYLVGRYLSYPVIHAAFADLGMKKTCRMLETMRPLSREARLEALSQSLPRWLAASVLKHRYLTIALALNLPGNAFIGGGGGIAMVAGLSGIFRTRPILVTFALAVCPVPLVIMLFGPNALFWVN